MTKQPKPNTRHLPKGLSIIHEDKDILVVDKPPGLLTIGTKKEKSRTAYFALTDYVRKGSLKSKNRIFIVHRLDRETSGVLIFAKNEEAKRRLQSQWKDTLKKYLAVVQGRCEKRSDTISSYLAENKAYFVYSTSDALKGKLARTFYRVQREVEGFSLLEIELLTGRKHQIRVHLADIGHPVLGDDKYGPGKSKYKRLALHALSITFSHPTSGKKLTIETKVPTYFKEIVGIGPEGY